jgi:long-chain acyl-CoA synthetase
MHTIPQLFEDSVKLYSANPLIYEKKAGKYFEISYKDVRDKVYIFGCGLINLGLNKKDRVALISEGRSEWLISELAVLYTGGIAVPLSTKINEHSDLLFRIQHSECRFIIVSLQQLEKVRHIIDELKTVEKIIVLDNPGKLNKNELTYSTVFSHGELNREKLEPELQSRWTSLKNTDLANISYTSGTTADPKGIMLTHRNYTANTEQANSMFDVPSWYTTLLILSWDHSFAHTVGLYVMITNGGSFAVVEQGRSPMETLRNIPKNIKEIRPVFQLSVPALARSFKKNIEAGIRAKGKRTEKLFNHALKVSYEFHGNGFDTQNKNVLNRLLVWFYDKILFSKIRENFGGRLQYFVGGGALLDIELQHFFYAIGIPMYQGYGLTEAAPVISSNTPAVHKLGTSGKIAANLEIKILDTDGKNCPAGEKGEIVVKGENVMKGYWNNQKATKETLKDGWLFTGDMGYLDKDGFLVVLGRYKSLLISNDGEKYSPEGIEETLIDHSKYIDQCMLYNNQNPYTVGLFVINASALKSKLKEKGINLESEEAVTESLKLIESDFAKYSADGELGNLFPQRWLPSAIGILCQPFTEENGMINSTLKMVRYKVTSHHAELINYLYSAEGKKMSNEKNRLSLQKLLSDK